MQKYTPALTLVTALSLLITSCHSVATIPSTKDGSLKFEVGSTSSFNKFRLATLPTHSSIAIVKGQEITTASSRVQTCYEVQDPDGWVNIRDRDSNAVVAQMDNGQRVVTEGTIGESALLAPPHQQFMIHLSRLQRAQSQVGCFRYTFAEPDGYLNLRESPQGGILGRIANGTFLITLGVSENKWVRVLTPEGRTGFVYSQGFEVAN